jgi:hypothetical protein
VALASVLGSIAAAALLTAGSSDPDSPVVRFRDAERPVKVIVLHGSVGAWQQKPYHQRLQGVCKNVEIQNLSKSGLGAWAIKQRFKELVVRNPSFDPKKSPDQEFWLLVGAGLNSVTAWQKTNAHLRALVLLAHDKGLKVMGLTPTPWGTDKEDKFQGLDGLTRRKATQRVADWVLGKLSPADALGSYVGERADATAGWDPVELPDVGVDVYDSPLRDDDAAPRDQAAIRAALEKSGSWKRAHADLSNAEREVALDSDAKMGAEVPQYFMKPELRAFDHIHPNAEGHRILAKTICPEAPASWGCNCDAL